MKIYISDSFTAACDSDNILGRIGETNSRTVEVEQPDVEGADSYRLRFCYDDDVIYDVPLNNGELTVSASLLRYAGIVNCVWIASKALGEGYQLVAKSNPVALEIQSGTDGSEAVPAPEVQTNLLDKCQEYANSALNACGQAESFANSSDENAQLSKASSEESKTYEQSAKNFSEQAEISANNALSSENSAKEYSETAAAKADEASSAAASAQNSAGSASQSAITATGQAEIATQKAAEISDNTAQIQQNKSDIVDLHDNCVYISPSGYMYSKDKICSNGASSIAQGAYSNAKMLESVTVPDTVTIIGDNAFKECKNLKSVTIPNGVTELRWYTFYYDQNLESVTLSDALTLIGDSVFRWCSSLKSITLPNTLTSININSFYHCDKLTDVTLGEDFNAVGLDLSQSSLKVESIMGMFENLKDLTGETAKTLTLGSTNLAKLTDAQKQTATDKNWNLA